MQTPQKDPPQSGRKASKQYSKPRTDVQRTIQSDNDAYQAIPQDGDQTPSKKNKKPRKKSNAKRSGTQSDVGEAAERPAYKNFPHKSTPAKVIKDQAYAGPTFHQSPAASALPMPSFFSRSVPTNPAVSRIAETADGTAETQEEDKIEVDKREITPLDWIFDAARQAKGTPNGASPARIVSPRSGSPAQSSPAIRDGDTDFPFELDGVGDSRSPYPTPFSHRLAAIRIPHSTSEGGQTLSEEERRAKTAALKQALMKSQDTASQLGPAFNDNNPFNARNAPSAPNLARHTSNPGPSVYQNGFASNQNMQYPQYLPNTPNRNFSLQPNGRTASSNLRNVYDPNPPPMSPPNTVPEHRISTARSPPPARALNFGQIYGQTSRPHSEGNPSGHAPKPSLEQGLDDLKKALNMNFLGQAGA